ncbi:uncharacterized protein [Arachis hypogaea]|uniref:uncharacterized protein isoform X2 n=1 Tax=Arachis hypogaea TaxID=3818 RepID=UPI000DECF726|nr:uncharacterized protein LOC112741498 isoform X2 [Arachis hypogaea]
MHCVTCLKRVGRLEPSRNMGVEEMVAMFLYIIAHDVKIRVIKRQFVRSEETISRRFNDVLLAILRCHNLLLKKPQPFSQDRMDERWKWFKDCLGALDGTHIKVNVLEADKPRYRNRKGDITTNVLGVVAPDMQFIYILAGWRVQLRILGYCEMHYFAMGLVFPKVIITYVMLDI